MEAFYWGVIVALLTILVIRIPVRFIHWLARCSPNGNKITFKDDKPMDLQDALHWQKKRDPDEPHQPPQ